MSANLLLLVTASASFAIGGIFMKYSAGLTRSRHTVMFLLLFCAGAMLQAYAMKRAEMSVVYTLVLGFEAVAAFLLSVFILGERATGEKIVALLLIVGGIALLERA